MPKTASVQIAVIGIDIGKNSFHVVGLDKRGAIVLRQKWSRGQVEARLANLSPCLIGMEACVGSHHLARKLASLGHDARLMPAKYVRPYAKGQKNDFNDAEAIAEAVQRPTMKFVATKTADQLDLQALHRVRERLVSQRTGIINQIRAFMLERGIAVRQGIRFLRTELPIALGSRTDVLSLRMVHTIEGLATDWRRLDERIDGLSDEIAALGAQDAGAQRLMSVPGVGPIISTAIVAAIGTGDGFSKGRDFAAWLGLVPKQISTGDRTILGKISKRGNRYVRKLLVQAAWVVLVKPQSWERHGLKPWIEAAKKRLHHNVLAIALANKLARIAWAVLAKGRGFEATRRETLAAPQPRMRAVTWGRWPTSRFPSPLIGRVGDWRAGLGRCSCSLLPRPFVCECHSISTLPRFQPPPRRTQRADFPHYAHLFASPQGLLDLSCWGDFRLWPTNPIAIEQLQAIVQPRPTPSRPAEALSFPGSQHMAPDLFLHPVLYEAEALAGMSHREVVHPAAQHRVDQLHDPTDGL
jgi:transposase